MSAVTPKIAGLEDGVRKFLKNKQGGGTENNESI